MLLARMTRGVSTGGVLARVTCTHNCESPQGASIRYRVQRGDVDYGGTLDCQPVADVPAPTNAPPGLYIVSAELHQVQNGVDTVLEKASIVAPYDPDAVTRSIDAPSWLHVFDPGLGLWFADYVGAGEAYVPKTLPGFVLARRPGKVRLVTADTDTGYVDAAKASLGISFSSRRDYYAWLLRFSGEALLRIYRIDEVECAAARPDEYPGVVAAAKLYTVLRVLESGNLVTSVALDDENAAVSISVAAVPGSVLGLDLGRLATFMAGGCVMGIVVAAITEGLAAPAVLLGCGFGAAAGFTVDVLFQSIEGTAKPIIASIEQLVSLLTGSGAVYQRLNEDLAKLNETADRIVKEIDELHASGKISDDAYRVLKADATAMKQLLAEHEKNVKDLMAKARDMAVVGLALGGVGGAALGYLFGKLTAGR